MMLNLNLIYQVLLAWANMVPDSIAKSTTFLEFIWEYMYVNRHYIILIILVIIIVYMTEWLRYKYKLFRYLNPETINLGKINIQGELTGILNPEQVALVLKAEFTSIKNCLDEMNTDRFNNSPAQAGSVDYYFFFSGIKDDRGETIQTSQNTSVPVINGLAYNPVLQSNITLGIGSFKIPLSDILRSFIAFVGLLPVVPRDRYKSSLINISLISHDNHVKMVVHCQGNGARKKKSHLASVTNLSSFQTMDDLNYLLRDLAFMVLGLQKAFENNCNWKSMRYLLDGFHDFTRFRNSGLKADRDKAKEDFQNAILEDPENNFQALYYCGVMLMVERTNFAIETAINYFRSAQRSKDEKLCALTNLGLAFCFSQSHHRLGRETPEMLNLAEESLKKAKKYWSGIKKQLPLIPYLEAMLWFVKSTNAKQEDKEKILSIALKYAYKSVELDPKNSMFRNNIGWALMMMAQYGFDQLHEKVLAPDDGSDTVLLAEKYLDDSLQLNPQNKLAHSNLCLLYSNSYFRNKNEEDKHNLIFLRARYHGMKAISLDNNYINAYRDLCFTYIRYHKIKEAEECLYEALKLAEEPHKDAELFQDIIKEAQANNIPENVIKRWSVPKEELFEPH